METAIILTRVAQYIAAATLFGTPLFLTYARSSSATAQGAGLSWARPLAGGAAFVVLLGSGLYLCAQTAMMAGDAAAATDPEMLTGVLTDSAMGFAVLARLAAAVLALVTAAVLKPGRPLWLLLSGLGAVVLLSFAWNGHGAATEGAGGWIHLFADLLHLLAAGVWIGALVAFAVLLARPAQLEGPGAKALHEALEGFSGVGSAVVTVIVATGLVNTWFLVGPTHLAGLFSTAYGLLLLAKLAAFGGMVLLAARNRFAHTPVLGRALTAEAAQPSLQALRISVALETVLGMAVLILVAILGMLEPVAAL
ncbi:copper homeostasis membrane protein CopD [Phenylobacterium soli]|uniref:Copper resistance protein CopD n=1 Tax=Phenylobacterium soli TaxID=2170551 RepID=A0A328AGZ2_9CAUL|nr:copper homeostasis membrane protein CopD [Phenylobacterium soli]RAK54153.1 copper resistance protein CopD [Phenylobacterium soli]